MSVPQSVKLALILFFTNIVNGIIGALLQVGNAPPELHRLIMVITSIVLLVLFSFVGYKLMRGSNLFRKINAVLVIIGTISAINGFSTLTFYHPAGVYLYWIGEVISVCVVILLFTPSANIWFQIDRRVEA